jgi:23S rRNA (uracil1939-C5)-methyltransferase
MARRRKKKSPTAKTTEHVLSISELGWHGDGVAEFDGKKIYVPRTLAGETVRAAVTGSRAAVLEILEASADRIEPMCPHFSLCGGCAVQHLAGGPYGTWKRRVIEVALANRQVEAAVEPLIEAHGNGRRRVTLHVRYENDQVLAGFMQAYSHRLIDIDHCPILVPELASATSIARDLAAAMTNNQKPLDIQLTATETGLDCAIRGGGELDLDGRMNLSDCANAHDLARISLDGELVLQRRSPTLTFGAAKLALPPGGFLQATKAGEDALTALVLEAFGDAGKVVDLYCGVGPFALRLAETRSVLAIDSDGEAIAALGQAADNTPGQKPVTTEVRDLAKNPLFKDELKGYDAVIFDPPRAGAEAQVLEIIDAKVATVVAVSCNPASFANDASLLTGSGYRLEKVTPIDQFRFAGHVEMVGVFRR